MAIDLDAIRKKLSQLSGNSSKRNTMWRPQEGEEHTVRLLSFQNNDGQPFKERYFYYNIGNNPGLLAPYQFGKPDPIQELITKLRDDGSVSVLALRIQREVSSLVLQYGEQLTNGLVLDHV